MFRTCLVAVLFLVAGSAKAQMDGQQAHADIVNSQGQKIGAATLSQKGAGVEIKLDASSLAPGTHGIHIHAVGKCEGPDFKSAGGHLNPDMKKHGTENPEGPHAGDMPNIEVGSDGQVHTTILAKGVTLGSGPNSVFHDGGTAIVIHEKADDYKTDPSGNSGNRIACGVIQK
jgi:superoxide dismutase, Cu-Zn family